ncbi:hypothetical protein [Microscilla marina]|uniref:Uncharacterized protein n=1 Tax=Microscilla marina ATCC 23134 TaxID=313606 RepID=A1ZCR2_MICM2|nr:hypothetical protein [Microscilla marina]EAY32064.1 hypothetical protein M23134_02093 [Microscilla marina ATCC 23134]
MGNIIIFEQAINKGKKETPKYDSLKVLVIKRLVKIKGFGKISKYRDLSVPFMLEQSTIALMCGIKTKLICSNNAPQ